MFRNLLKTAVKFRTGRRYHPNRRVVGEGTYSQGEGTYSQGEGTFSDGVGAYS
jgi:hypothetical protein